VLWSYRMRTKVPNRETPFALTFITEVVIPVQVGSLSYQVEHYNLGMNNEGIRLHLDLLQERKDKAQVTMAAYQRKSEQYFNKRLRSLGLIERVGGYWKGKNTGKPIGAITQM